VTAALLYLAVYAFMQFGAFAVVVMLRRKDVIGDELKDLSGLYFARTRGAAIAMLIFMLSLGGIPPTAGFMGKLWIFGAAIDAGYVWLAVIGVLNSAVSLYYYVRVVAACFMWIVFGVYPRALFEFAEASRRRSAPSRTSGYDSGWNPRIPGREAQGAGRQHAAGGGAQHRRVLVRPRHRPRRRLRPVPDAPVRRRPLGVLRLLLFGLAAGVLNVYRTAGKFLK
jgi:hypothetical protein